MLNTLGIWIQREKGETESQRKKGRNYLNNAQTIPNDLKANQLLPISRSRKRDGLLQRSQVMKKSVIVISQETHYILQYT